MAPTASLDSDPIKQTKRQKALKCNILEMAAVRIMLREGMGQNSPFETY